MTQLPVVVARDLTDAEVRQLKEVAAAVEPAADGTPVTTDLDAYMRELLEAGVSLVANADEFRISASPMPARGAWPVSCKGWQARLRRLPSGSLRSPDARKLAPFMAALAAQNIKAL